MKNDTHKEPAQLPERCPQTRHGHSQPPYPTPPQISRRTPPTPTTRRPPKAHAHAVSVDRLPPAAVLKARINAYKRNDKHLLTTLQTIKQKQTDLESKFRRVLSLCLKIDEHKVDAMLDGLLQAISSEDPQDVDTDEMQHFLKKHAPI